MEAANAYDFDSDFDDDYEQSTFEQDQPSAPIHHQQIPIISINRPTVVRDIQKDEDAIAQIQQALDDPELQRLMEEQDRLFLNSAPEKAYNDTISFYFLLGVLVVLAVLGTWILYWVRKGKEVRREMKEFGYYKI